MWNSIRNGGACAAPLGLLVPLVRLCRASSAFSGLLRESLVPPGGSGLFWGAGAFQVMGTDCHTILSGHWGRLGVVQLPTLC